MGVYAQTNGSIHFKDELTASKGFFVLHNWIKDAMSEKLEEQSKNGGYNITNLTRDGSSLEFFASSSRVQNLMWQMENLREVAKRQDGCMNFDALVMSEHELVYWDVSEDEDEN